MVCEKWLMKNSNERVVDYEPMTSGEIVVKYKNDHRVDRCEKRDKYAFTSVYFCAMTCWEKYD